MRKNELIKLRKLVNDEMLRRKRINELLKNKLVQEYLQITKTNSIDLSIDVNDILSRVLELYAITSTNGIYVCTDAYYSYSDLYYELKTIEVDINSDNAEYKIYKDIESNEEIRAQKSDRNRYSEPLISDFEKDNIVLNPYNTYVNNNGFSEVKNDFFIESLNHGQAKARKYILSKYNRL